MIEEIAILLRHDMISLALVSKTKDSGLLLVNAPRGFPMEETLARAGEAGLRIAPAKKLSNAIARSGISKDFACWTGTMTAYREPGQELGAEIDYTDEVTRIRYIFPVPEEHRKKKNAILVAKHPKFTLEEDGMFRTVRAAEVGLVPYFPAYSDKWYRGDEKYGIPNAEEISGRLDTARYLWRIDKRVGLAACDYNWRNVFLDYCPSVALAVAIEVNTTKRLVPAGTIRSMTLGEFMAAAGDSDLAHGMPRQNLEAVRSLLLEMK